MSEVNIETVRTITHILDKCDRTEYPSIKEKLLTALKEQNYSLIDSLYATWCDSSSSKKYLHDNESKSSISLDEAVDMIENQKKGLQSSLEIMSILSE